MTKVKFRDCIRGLGKLIDGDIPQGSIVLVTGAPGTLKSAFVYSMLTEYLGKSNESGIYFTLEQSKDSLLQNMRSLGMNDKKNKLEVVDFSEFRDRFRESNKGINMYRIAEDIIEYFKRTKNEKPTCFALDSLTAMVPFLGEVELRAEIFHLFQLLRKNKLTSLIICEVPSLYQLSEYSPEYFLGDAVIEMGILKLGRKFVRYLQILKMRGTAHDIGRHQMIVDRKGISIGSPI